MNGWISLIKKIRTKVIHKEAMQYVCNNWVDVMKFAGPDNSKWNYIGNFLEIKTLNGFVRPSEGDWIVKGLGGEFYPCDKKVFAETYDIVDTL